MALTHQEKKAIIVEAAREVFGKYGYSKTTIEDISSSLYRAKSSIYYYFKSKEDIFRAVVEYEAQRARKAIMEAVAREITPETKLRAHFMTTVTFVREAVSYYNLMREDVIDILDFSDEVKSSHHHEVIQSLSAILTEGVETGVFAVDDVQDAAESLAIAFDWLYRPLYGVVEGADERVDRLLGLILKGLRAR